MVAIGRDGGYVSPDRRLHPGLLRTCHNRLVMQMSKALGALPRIGFGIGAARLD